MEKTQGINDKASKLIPMAVGTNSKTMLRKIVIFFILMLSLVSCKKDEQDYRAKYTGNFNFTVVEEFWMLGQPTQIDTSIFQGSIRIFQMGDENNDLDHVYDSLKNIGNRITITFGNNLIITPQITGNGKFIEKGGYHYYHTGEFTNNRELQFVVGGLGGLGAGTNYSITGNKK